MINKIFKSIFNKYSKIFKFLFFLRYLFLIFLISSSTYLLVPKFLDYEEKQVNIKKYFLQNYGLAIQDIEEISYKIFPFPNLRINNANINVQENNYKIEAKKIYIYLDIFKIYNFKKFTANRIEIIDSKLDLKTNGISNLYKTFTSLKKKISFDNLSIKIFEDNTPVIFLKNINISNYGYKKNKIQGEVFNKKFKIYIAEKIDKITFKLKKTGIFGEIIYINNDGETNKKEGTFKGKILNSNIKFKFSINENQLNINSSFFRNKNLSFDGKGEITFSPFLNIVFNSNIKEINKDYFSKIDLKKLLENKDFLKRLNINQEINFMSKRFSRNLIENLNVKFDLAYGRLASKKIINFDEGKIICSNEINLIEENPLLIFNCSISSNNTKKFLKTFLINYENKKYEFLNLIIKGNFNLFKKKVNFLKIQMNDDYKASEEDLKFFKVSFENFLVNNNPMEIFNKKKLKKFINEIL